MRFWVRFTSESKLVQQEVFLRQSPVFKYTLRWAESHQDPSQPGKPKGEWKKQQQPNH